MSKEKKILMFVAGFMFVFILIFVIIGLIKNNESNDVDNNDEGIHDEIENNEDINEETDEDSEIVGIINNETPKKEKNDDKNEEENLDSEKNHGHEHTHGHELNLLTNNDEKNQYQKNTFLKPSAVSNIREIPLGFHTDFFELVGSNSDFLYIFNQQDMMLGQVNKKNEKVLFNRENVLNAVMKDNILLYQYQRVNPISKEEEYIIKFIDHDTNRERDILTLKNPIDEINFSGKYFYYHDIDNNKTYFVNALNANELQTVDGLYDFVQVDESQYESFLINKFSGKVDGIIGNNIKSIFDFQLNERIIDISNSPFIKNTVPNLIYSTSTNPYSFTGEKLFFNDKLLFEDDMIGQIGWVHENTIFIKREDFNSTLSLYHLGLDEEAIVDIDVVKAFYDEFDNRIYYFKPFTKSLFYIDLHF